MFVDPFPTFHFAQCSFRVRCSEGSPVPPATPDPGGGQVEVTSEWRQDGWRSAAGA